MCVCVCVCVLSQSSSSSSRSSPRSPGRRSKLEIAICGYRHACVAQLLFVFVCLFVCLFVSSPSVRHSKGEIYSRGDSGSSLDVPSGFNSPALNSHDGPLPKEEGLHRLISSAMCSITSQVHCAIIPPIQEIVGVYLTNSSI